MILISSNFFTVSVVMMGVKTLILSIQYRLGTKLRN